MAKHASRKLFLFGRYSLAMLPPKKWLTELGLQKGDRVELELDSRRKRIVIRFSDNTSKPAAPKTEKPSDDGWQPVPQL